MVGVVILAVLVVLVVRRRRRKAAGRRASYSLSDALQMRPLSWESSIFGHDRRKPNRWR